MYTTAADLVVVMELASEGELFNVLERGGALPEPEARCAPNQFATRIATPFRQCGLMLGVLYTSLIGQPLSATPIVIGNMVEKILPRAFIHALLQLTQTQRGGAKGKQSSWRVSIVPSKG